MPGSRRRHPAVLALSCAAVAGALSCGGDPTAPVPTVVAVAVEPGTGFLDLTDTLRLRATPTGADGAPVADAGLTWRSASGNATVDEAGLVTGVAPGEARIEAVASNGTVGSALLRITPVTGLEPSSGRYGQSVTVLGQDLPPAVAVFFSDGGDGRIPARVRSADPDALEVWVPVGAGDGPLELVWPGDAVVTSHTFDLTADEDLFAGVEQPVALPFPFENPSLLADGAEPRAFRFTLPAPSPFSLELLATGPADGGSAARAWLFRVDTEPATLLSFGLTRDFLAGGMPLDSVVYSRAQLPAGDYVLLVSAMDLADETNETVRRGFGIRTSAASSFALPPDAREPNDFPAEAPGVGLPFTAAGLRVENPFAMDHYTFRVSTTSTVSVSATAADPLLLLLLIPAGTVDVLAAWEDDAVLAEAGGEAASQTIRATVSPGRYTALVWDWGGRARPYDLEIRASGAGAVGVAGAEVGGPAGEGGEAAAGVAASGGAAAAARGAASLPASARDPWLPRGPTAPRGGAR